jgi:signal transduction histidine kinase
MLILAVLLGVATAVFAILFVLQIAQNKRLSRKLRKLNDENRTQLLTMSFPSKPNEKLVSELNRLILAKEEQSQIFQVKEHNLQQAISNISHDMRTPLTTILGYVHLINQSGISEQERENYMRIVEIRARALKRLIEDFYDLSRIDEGEYQFENTWLDINNICLESLAMAYDDFANMGMEVDINLPSKAPKVFADKNAVGRVFENILGNIKKHGKDKLVVSGKIEGSSLELSFENGSVALSQHELERVFERSYTLSDSRTNENTGLGLSICKALLNKMGHDIEASYHEGCFTITTLFSLRNEESSN